MIVSKNALQVVNLTTADKSVPVLDTVRVESDGTVVASNRETTVCVSPVQPRVAEKLPLKSLSDVATTMTSDTARETIKLIGVDRKFGGLLEHVDISLDEGNIQVSMYDGKRTKAVQAKPYPKDYFDYQDLFQRVYDKPIKARVLLNRKRLKLLLDTIEKICMDGSDFAVLFAEFSEDGDMVVKAINRRTGQKVVGIVRGVKDADTLWIEADDWERRLSRRGAVQQDLLPPARKLVKRASFIRKRVANGS